MLPRKKWLTTTCAVVAVALLMPDPAAAHEGWGVAVDKRGRIYVADIPANTIWRITTDGRMERVARHIHSHALTVGADGVVYGTHSELQQPIRSVWRIGEDDKLHDIIPPTRDFPLALQSFLRAPDGAVYSASAWKHPAPATGREQYLLRWSPGGQVNTIAGGILGLADGSGRAARFQNIDGMALLPDGSIILADGARLRRVTLSGEVTTLGAPLTEARWDQDLLGVAVGPDGAIYAADFASRVVHRMQGGAGAVMYRSKPFWAPTGIAATSGGVYVLEHPRAPLGILGDIGIGPYLRVRRIDTDGATTTLATQWGVYSVEAFLVLMGIAIAAAAASAWRRGRVPRVVPGVKNPAHA